MGYLGKISAVVSVNTGDFAAKLNACARDVKSFAASTERDLKTASRSAAKSFGSIYTEVQKLERSLRAATSLKLDFTGLKGLEGKGLQEAADHMRQIHSVAAQISAPLAEAAKKSESLAASIRGGIHPALESTQKAAEEMQSAVAAGTSISIRQFSELEAIVRKTSDAMNRVSQAGGMVGDLTGGKDFRTQSPQAYAALERAQSAQKSVYDLPAGTITSAPSLLARQKAAAMAVAAAYANVESKRDLGQDQTGALASLQKKINLLEKVNSLIEKEVGSHTAAAAAIAAANKATSAAIEQANKDAAAAIQKTAMAAKSLRDSLSKIADSVGEPAAPIDRARLAIDRMNDAIEKLQDPSKKAIAEGVAASIRKNLEAEVAISEATGNAPAGSVMDAAAKRAARLAGAVEGVNKAAPAKKADADLFGADVGSSERKIDSLKSKASSLRREFDKLSEPLQGKLAVAFNRMRDDFLKLTPKSSAADIQRVTIQYERLEKVVKRLNQAAAFKGTFADTLADSGAKKYAEQLQKIETAMAHVGAAARGPTATAINALRAALMTATMTGTVGTDKVRESIQALTTDIEKAIVAEGKLTAKQARAVMGGATQTGDVGRGLSGKLSLGLNQAAYIVDDFMSATGGAEQKLRAISNNITQLGFVIGSTTGLFVALGSVIALQGYLALTKWINSGRSAEDQTKALNDSLEKQKTLTDSLAQSFESLADSIAQSAMSAESFSGKQLDKQLSEIKKQQKDLREEELYRLSPDVNAARASQNLADKAIKAATTEAAMLAAQNRMTQAKSDEDRAKAGVRARASAGLSNPEVVSAIAQSFRPEAKFSASRNFEAGGDIFSPEAINAAAARLAERFLDRAASAGQSGADVLAARSLELSQRGRAGSAFSGDQEAMVSLQRSIEILKLPMKEGADNLAVSVSRASSEAASRIKEAQDRVAEAIQAGTPGAAEFSVTLSKTADALALAQEKITKATAESDPAARAALISSAKQEVAAISGEASRQLAASRDMMFGGLGVKGGKGGQLSGLRRVEGAGGALAALEGSAEYGGRGGAQATALRGLIAKEAATRADLARSMTFGNAGQKMQAAFNLEQAQEQLRRFTDGLPEEIKAAGDATKMAARQSGKDEKSRAEMIERGRELLASPKSKTVAAFRKDLEAATMAAGGPGGAGVAEFVKNRIMEAAPAIAQMNAERAAAINPPYFSALQASDTSTSDGQRELNRLLRGEDASKDKNLDELKTQSELIRELITVAKQHGVVVEL